eukprot:scaffold18579_cov202-Isochrysis_galbana.AAC.3
MQGDAPLQREVFTRNANRANPSHRCASPATPRHGPLAAVHGPMERPAQPIEAALSTSAAHARRACAAGGVPARYGYIRRVDVLLLPQRGRAPLPCRRDWPRRRHAAHFEPARTGGDGGYGGRGRISSAALSPGGALRPVSWVGGGADAGRKGTAVVPDPPGGCTGG